MRRILALLCALALPATALAQMGSSGNPMYVTAAPGSPLPVASGSGTALSTTTNGTVTTANTFQQVAAQNTSRKGCLITNSSVNDEFIFLGTTGSATLANSTPVHAGGRFSCTNPGGLVIADAIQITSSVTASTFVTVVQ